MNSSSIARIIALVALGALFFVPTFISESLLFPFITGKNFVFRLLVLAVALVSAYLILTTRKITSPNTPTHKIFAVLVGVLGISAFFAENTTRSLWSNFERMEGWFTHALLLLFFVLLYNAITTAKQWRNLFKVSLLANVYVLIFALMQYVGAVGTFQSTRLDATLGNATYLAGYFLFYFFILLWLLSTTKEVLARYTYGALALINVLFIFLSLTRGGMLGLIVAGFLMLVLFTVRKTEFPVMKKVSIGLIGIGIVLVGLFFTFKDSTFIQTTPALQRLSTISVSDWTAQSRFYIWQMSYEGFKERPLFGHGQDNFLYVFSKHFDPRMGAYEPWYDRSHNVFFDWLIAGGILGLIGYLALYGVSFYVLWIRKNAKEIFGESERIIWTGFFVAYFIFNLFVFDNIVSYILFVFILAYLTWRSYADKGALNTGLSKSVAGCIAGALVVIGLLGIIFLVYKPWSTARTLIQGMQYSDAALAAPTDAQAQAWSKQLTGTAYTKAELLTLARGKFEQATQYPLGRTEAREQLAQKLISIINNQSVTNEEKNIWAKLALEQLEDEIKRDPTNPRTYQLVGSLLLQFGKYKEALVYLDQAQKLAPKKQLIMFDRAVAYQINGDYQRSLEISKEAYELHPPFLTAKARYIFALYRVGKDAEAEAIEPQFIQDALAQSYDLVTNKAYYDQVIGAKIDYRAREAVVAYEEGDMGTYNKYLSQIRDLSPEAATRLLEIIKASK
jgi:O-antigen ligase/tetratricopeptide (TPR) repeat protein